MNEQDIEKKLQSSAEKIEVREFSQVWKNIQGEVQTKRAKNRKLPKWAYALISSVAAVALISAVTVPIIFNNFSPEEKVYFWEQLNAQSVEDKEFFENITESKVRFIDIESYISSGYKLFATEEGVVKGGKVEITDSTSIPSFYCSVEFYDSSVELKKTDEVFDLQYTTTQGAKVEYKLKQSQTIYVYDIKASFQSVNYFMELTCFTEDIKPFLDSFFQL